MISFKASSRLNQFKAAGVFPPGADLSIYEGQLKVTDRRLYTGNGSTTVYVVGEPTQGLIQNVMVYVNGLLQSGSFTLQSATFANGTVQYYVVFGAAPAVAAPIMIYVF